MNCNWVRRGSSANAAAVTADADDDWAMAKAAAWAWYMRRSGADDSRASPESDLGRFIRRRNPPSRYKQEAASANTVAAAEDEVGPTGVAVPLLDLYEIERITRQLERLIGGDGGTLRKEAAAAMATASPSPPSPSTPSMTPTRKAGRKWACHPAGICGEVGDAVGAAPLVARRRGKAARQ